ERIWVTHNEDWLRAQQAKILKQQLEEAEGGPPKKRSYKKKDRGRMGDGTVLEGGTPVASPADASAKMINKRAKGFSNRINYAKLSEIYSGEVAEETRSQASAPSRASRAGTAAAAATRSPSAAPSASPAPSQGVEAATVEASKGADGAGLATPPATQTQQSQQGKSAEEPTVVSEDEEEEDDGEDEDDVESEINEDEEAEHAIEEIGYGEFNEDD
ncbi:hypothetical protein B0A49_13938, partial [Cryomyces minteri]